MEEIRKGFNPLRRSVMCRPVLHCIRTLSFAHVIPDCPTSENSMALTTQFKTGDEDWDERNGRGCILEYRSGCGRTVRNLRARGVGIRSRVGWLALSREQRHGTIIGPHESFLQAMMHGSYEK